MSLSSPRPPRNDPWIVRPQQQDPLVRRMTYGKARPMDYDPPFAFLQRWLRRV